ncbi:MAG: DUF922 domain-containing protein [Chitinophagales bacterium]
MNLLLLLTSISWFSSTIPSPGNKDEIRWSQRSDLTFSDFKGEVPPNTPWAALTSSIIYFTYNTYNGKISTIKVYASFKKNESWIKNNLNDVLAHEQLHFAITEYFARKLYDDAQELKEHTGDISIAANALFKSINKDCDRMQEQYDEATEHGMKLPVQEKWKTTVDKLLSEYDSYPAITD